MSTGRFHAIVNPTSSGGRTAALWATLEPAFRAQGADLTVSHTSVPGEATTLTRAALDDRAQVIVAVGGDGTVNECVNGFFRNGQPIAPQADLALVMSGTGGDLRRTLGFSGVPDHYVQRALYGEARLLDVGHLTFVDDDGQPAERYFLNIASFGISGAVDRAVNAASLSKWLGGSFAFYWNAFVTTLTYDAQTVRIRVDDHCDVTVPVHVCAVSNGEYFGGGMHIAPDADPSDGLFDVVIIRKMSLARSLGSGDAIYKGTHIHDPDVTVLRGRMLVAEPVAGAAPVLLDVDGEAPGRLPAHVRLLPGAIRVRT